MGRNLKNSILQGMDEAGGPKKLTLESFGEIMDRAVQESACGLVVYKEAGEADFQVQGAGCGSVMDFYILLNALPALYDRMLEEMGGRLGHGVDGEGLADALGQQMAEELKKKYREEAGT